MFEYLSICLSVHVYCMCVCLCMYVLMYVCMSGLTINALAQGIKSFLASQVWFQAVGGARTYGTDSPAITSQPR